jgi:hypothetical protein
MKKVFYICFISALFLFACEKNDYRDDVIGTYKGRAYINDAIAQTYWWDNDVTVIVSKHIDESDMLVFTGDILQITGSQPEYWNVTLNCSNDSIETGVFNGDSLYFKMHDKHYFTYGYYYLKKQ